METPSQEKNPKRIFVELGVNGLAVPWIGEKKFGQDELYIGIDVDREALENSKWTSEDPDLGQSNLLFIEANGEKIPVRDGSVHEVFMGNVLGDPHIPGESKDRFIQEARRILAPDGKVVIKENNTPADLDFVKELLVKNGFSLEKYVDSNSPEWGESIRPYYSRGAREQRVPFALTDYMIVATPNPTK